MKTEKSRNEIDCCYDLFSLLLSILWMVAQYIAVNMRWESV